MRVLAGLREIWDKYTQGLFGNIIYVVLGFLIAYSANIVLGLALNTDTPVVAVVSDSMEPTFYKGDMLFVIGDYNYKLNDIIVYDVVERKYPIIHRIIKINENGTFETKGDHNSGQLSFELNVKEEQIHGKAVFKIPVLGWVKIIFLQILGLL